MEVPWGGLRVRLAQRGIEKNLLQEDRARVNAVGGGDLSEMF